ncbi:MAG: sugar kinase, partial [Actinomycetota bacterium]|nr:sugar kinase [Actinomycetota bacterium]
MDATLRGLFAGLTTVDVVHRLERLPGPDEKVTAARQDVVAGGPAANAASTFAGLGGVATLVTGLGRHPLAAAARADL